MSKITFNQLYNSMKKELRTQLNNGENLKYYIEDDLHSYVLNLLNEDESLLNNILVHKSDLDIDTCNELANNYLEYFDMDVNELTHDGFIMYQNMAVIESLGNIIVNSLKEEKTDKINQLKELIQNKEVKELYVYYDYNKDGEYLYSGLTTSVKKNKYRELEKATFQDLEDSLCSGDPIRKGIFKIAEGVYTWIAGEYCKIV